jgi:Flp pilus assembly protein TadD
MRRDLAIVGVLVLAVLAVYWPVSQFGFVNYDDGGYVSRNPHVQAGLTLEGLGWALTTVQESNWHPVTWLSHMLDCQLFGLDAGRHHMVNVALHAANAVLLFLLLRRMTKSRWPSAVVAALFALHPLHVESVAWIAERKDVLSTFFGLLALGAYLRYVEQPGRGRYVLVAVLFALGLMAKPMLVTLPFVLLLLDYWPLGRLQWPKADKPDRRKEVFKAVLRLAWEKAPLFLMAAASSIVTYMAQSATGTVAPAASLSAAERIANALVAYVQYLGTLVWPNHLAVLYPYVFERPTWQVAGSALLLVGVTAAVLTQVRRRPYLAVGWFWYLGTLVPVIGLVQVGVQGMADRYTYVPLVGIFIALAWGIRDVATRWQFPPHILAPATGVVLLAFAVLAGRQVQYWSDSQTLFRHTLDAGAASPVAHLNLGAAIAPADREEAIRHFREALRVWPDYAEGHCQLGTLLAAGGRNDEALAHYLKTVELDPRCAKAHGNIGAILAGRGQIEEGVWHLRAELELHPDYDQAINNLAWVMATQSDPKFRDPAEAVRLAEKACQLTGRTEASYLDTLAVAYARSGRFAEAVTTAEEAANLAKRTNQPALLAEIRERLQLYKAGQPFPAPPAPPR